MVYLQFEFDSCTEVNDINKLNQRIIPHDLRRSPDNPSTILTPGSGHYKDRAIDELDSS